MKRQDMLELLAYKRKRLVQLAHREIIIKKAIRSIEQEIMTLFDNLYVNYDNKSPSK